MLYSEVSKKGWRRLRKQRRKKIAIGVSVVLLVVAVNVLLIKYPNLIGL